ncbi:hypothetical protein M5K25_010140 [Dendrobium thyrsiflorum]|uniref:Retrotransposon Copia-like N-terminal domain-containing protein n=1 Tax=Dendrobium thyrsiflorum TaxID=117978 RepID=A0ABD0V6T0_DENTH
MASSATPSDATSSTRPNCSISFESSHIPQQLKFLMSSIKGIISLTLTSDNYPLWHSQVFKLFKVNGFEGFLDGSCTYTPPDTLPSPTTLSYQTWTLLDQNLAAALYSVISPKPNHVPIFPSNQIQGRCHSRGYSPLHPKDVILYTLNSLPPQYQAFKTAIRTNFQPMSLDDLYTLLCNEEQNIAQEATKELQNLQLSDSTIALAAPRSHGRGRNTSASGRSFASNRFSRNRPNKSLPPITCQICSKTGHSAMKCWHRHDPNYNDETPKTSLFTQSDSIASSDWFLDTGATSHLTSDSSRLHSIKCRNSSNNLR